MSRQIVEGRREHRLEMRERRGRPGEVVTKQDEDGTRTGTRTGRRIQCRSKSEMSDGNTHNRSHLVQRVWQCLLQYLLMCLLLYGVRLQRCEAEKATRPDRLLTGLEDGTTTGPGLAGQDSAMSERASEHAAGKEREGKERGGDADTVRGGM